MGFPSKIQHTGSKHFKMGIYENTFWAHLKHIQWYGPLHHGTHIVPCIQSMVCWCTRFHGVFWQARIKLTSIMASGWFWRGHLITKTQGKTWTKRVPVEQKWSNHGTHVEWENISSISWTYLCSGDFKRQVFFPFCAWVRICFQRLAAWVSPVQRCAWCHLNCTWEFHNHRRECVHEDNSQTKHDQMVPSCSARVLFDSDGNGKFGQLKYVISIVWW